MAKSLGQIHNVKETATVTVADEGAPLRRIDLSGLLTTVPMFSVLLMVLPYRDISDITHRHVVDVLRSDMHSNLVRI